MEGGDREGGKGQGSGEGRGARERRGRGGGGGERETEGEEGERGEGKRPVTDVLVISIPLTFEKHLASFPTRQEECLASHMRSAIPRMHML